MRLLYFGPETMMPVASFIAAVAGAILMFWRRILGFSRALFGRVFHRRNSTVAQVPAAPTEPPDHRAQGR